MDKNLFVPKVKEYVAKSSTEDLAKYFALAKTPEWANVVEAGEDVSPEAIRELKAVMVGYHVPGYILSDDGLTLLFVTEMMCRFFR